MYEKLYEEHVELLKDANSNGFISIACPFHEDDKPSACINTHNGIFRCQGCDLTLSPQSFLQKLLQITYEESKQLIVEFLHSSDDKPVEIKYIKSRPVSKPEWNEKVKIARNSLDENSHIVQEYMQARDLKFETLVRKGVGFLPAIQTDWKVDSLAIPYTYNNSCIAIRYRDIIGRKGCQETSNFHLFGVDELDEQQTVVVVEGESDCLKAFQALDYNTTVVSTPTATFKKEWEREFEDVKQVILIPQSDVASESLISKAKMFLEDKVTVLELPWSKREIGKDICDWCANRSEEEFASLVKSRIHPAHKKVMSGREMRMVASSEQPWIIKNFIAYKQSGIIGGPAKSYKTWLILNIVRCILTPQSYLFGIPEIESVSADKFNKNILIIEEEGTLEELFSRSDKVLDGIDNWEDRVYFMHQMRVRLDSPNWEVKLRKHIEEYNIGLVLIDPFQRTFVGDENDANVIGTVWKTLANLLSEFDELAILLIHHFKKSGEISKGFESYRGSSRIAGEVDLGVFVEKRGPSEGVGVKVKFDGRSIPRITTADNKDVFKLVFKEGIFTLDNGQIRANMHEALAIEVDERGQWGLTEAAQHFNVSTETIKNWVKRADLTFIRAAGQKRAMIKPKMEV